METVRTMNPRKRKTWEETALVLAETIARCRSEDPYMQVGACAVLQDNSVSLGYNGPPPKIEIDWSDRDSRLARECGALSSAKGEAAGGNTWLEKSVDSKPVVARIQP
jgi:deoxycytidylate deaminase